MLRIRDVFWIPDPNFHSGSRIQCWQDKIKDFYTKIRSRMFILVPGSCLWFFSIPDPDPGSRGQMATGHDYGKKNPTWPLFTTKKRPTFLSSSFVSPAGEASLSLDLHNHRLNMEQDLQSSFGLLCTAALLGWDPATPPPTHLGSNTRALLVNQDRQRLFVTPCALPKSFYAVLQIRISIRIRIRRILMFLDLLGPDPLPVLRGKDPDSSIIT